MLGVGGHGEKHERVREALRWLGAPPTLLALAVLVLNDHVLKQAAPGVVTGKLSDVAGLVLAPPLLAVALALLRVPRVSVVALVATGLGFTLVKSTAWGVDAANAVWSVVWPTQMLRDPTDLVALPALLLSALVGRHERVRQPGPRRQVAVALGALALPFAVFATAATSCSTPQGLQSVGVVRGNFSGPPGGAEDRIVLALYGSTRSILRDGTIQALNEVDSARIDDLGPRLGRACSRAYPQQCWRGAGGRDDPRVEVSTDAGATWVLDYAVPAADITALRKEQGESCGEEASVSVQDLAVLDTPEGAVVAVASGNAGLLLRTPDAGWTRLGVDDLQDRERGAPTPDPDVLFTPLDPTPTPTRYSSTTGPIPRDNPTAPAPPPVPCATSTVITVSPHPSNGTPFPREVCLG